MKRSEILHLRKLHGKDLRNTDYAASDFISFLEKKGLIEKNLYQEQEMEDTSTQFFMDKTEYPEEDTELSKLHSHLFYEIIYITGGNIQYLLQSNRYNLAKGDIIIIPPGTTHCPLFPKKLQEPYTRYVTWVSPATVRLIRKKHGYKDYLGNAPTVLHTTTASNEYLSALFAQILQEEEDQSLGWDILHECLLQAYLVYIERLRIKRKGISRSIQRELLDEIMYYTENHLDRKLSLESIAEHFHVSESTVSHLFRKRFGISFYRCVIQMRLIAAKNRILQGHSLEATALEVGFSDYSSFYRAFRNEFGISPSQYRDTQTEWANIFKDSQTN